MKSLFLTAIIAGGLMAATSATASAGGWQGGEHWMLRGEFAQGFTLTRMWRRLDNR